MDSRPRSLSSMPTALVRGTGGTAMIVGRGTLLAHLFENRPVGLPRNVYWGLFLSELQGNERGAGEFESVGCDWVTFPVRRFTQLANLSLADCMHPSLIEC